MSIHPILLIPEKHDIETNQIGEAWINLGGEVRRLGKYWIKDPSLNIGNIAVYGNQTFALVLAQIYEIPLTTPDDTLIARLDKQWTKRTITIDTLGNASNYDFPLFLKPVIPKNFTAKVYNTSEDMASIIAICDQEEEVIISSVIENITAECRAYILNGKIMDIAFYEGSGNADDCQAFLQSFIDHNNTIMPKTLVVDLAYSPHTDWLILEFNASWGAGLNGCDADKVIYCIIESSIAN